MTATSIKCVISGAGPVGTLAALYAAHRGWTVELFDIREDIRKISPENMNDGGPAKSMELALSERTVAAIGGSCSPELLNAVRQKTMQLKGRMIHGRRADSGFVEYQQLYDIQGRCLEAIDRRTLTGLFLDELEKYPNVHMYFRHKISGVDYAQQTVSVRQLSSVKHKDNDQGEEQQGDQKFAFDLLLGCDGAHSAVRTAMMRACRLSYSQTWIDIMWCQFTIPAATEKSYISPSGRDGFATSPDHLHIWPHNDMMLMAIPAIDKTIVGTFFAPPRVFTELEADPSQVRSFFEQHFPGAAELVGPDDVQRQFEQNAHEHLISIKCSPHVYNACTAILGDAAHAMVPFYGQGVNTGLEDVRVLFSHLDAHAWQKEGFEKALDCYNSERVPDAHAINDMALANYWEMRVGVRSPLRLLRKKIEEFLARYAPFTFVTQYSRVSFSNQRYTDIIGAVANQQTLLNGVAAIMSMLAATVLAMLIWMMNQLLR